MKLDPVQRGAVVRGRDQGPGPGRHRRRHRPPYAWGLAIGGTDGVVHVLRSILAEADLITAVDGYPALADLTPATLRRTGPPG